MSLEDLVAKWLPLLPEERRAEFERDFKDHQTADRDFSAMIGRKCRNAQNAARKAAEYLAPTCSRPTCPRKGMHAAHDD